jgi:hypothetical protein
MKRCRAGAGWEVKVVKTAQTSSVRKKGAKNEVDTFVMEGFSYVHS